MYRLHDDRGDLLYIGIAGNPGQRFEQHAGVKPWWGEVRTILLDHYPNRSSAEAAEAEAIHYDHPRYNRIRPYGSEPGARTTPLGGFDGERGAADGHCETDAQNRGGDRSPHHRD